MNTAINCEISHHSTPSRMSPLGLTAVTRATPTANRRGSLLAALVVVGLVILVSSCNAVLAALDSEPPTPQASSSSPPSMQADSILAAAYALKVREPHVKGYSREEFGQPWADVDRNACDQRNDVLRRDLGKRHTKPGTNGCVLLSGVLRAADYGRKVRYERGSNKVEIDHVVSLANAWQMGAYRWDAKKRERFANDFVGLEAVDAETNRDKGDSAADEWLPKDPDQQCSYVIIQVVIKTLYHLGVTKAERGAFVEVLTAQDCEGGTWPLLDRSDFKVPKPKPIGEPKPKPVKKPVKRSEPAPRNCTPGYSPCLSPASDYDCRGGTGNGPKYSGPVRVTGSDPYDLDRDGDGRACEWS
jgi:hypothetical protein